MFSKRKRGETETRLVKKPELGKNIPGKNRYEDPEAKKIFSNFAEQGKKKKNHSEAQLVQRTAAQDDVGETKTRTRSLRT